MYQDGLGASLVVKEALKYNTMDTVVFEIFRNFVNAPGDFLLPQDYQHTL